MKFSNKKFLISTIVGIVLTLIISVWSWFFIVDSSLLQGTFLYWTFAMSLFYFIPLMISGVFLGLSHRSRLWYVPMAISYILPIIFTLLALAGGSAVAGLS